MRYRFTNRTGGFSSGSYSSLNMGLHVGDNPLLVVKNREIISNDFGPTQFMNQVHGNTVAVIEEVADPAPTADALVTGIPGIALAVQVADCIPLLLASSTSVAAVHVGRKGLTNGVTESAIDVMRAMGAGEITALIGPSICGECYEVSSDIFAEVIALHPAAESRSRMGAPALDLPAGLREILCNNSINFTEEGGCTLEDSQLFSYRREGVTGRQIGVITL
jgi:YfiH family protein